jgi:hypothetical protein
MKIVICPDKLPRLVSHIGPGKGWPIGTYSYWCSGNLLPTWREVIKDTFENLRWVEITEQRVPANIRAMVLLMT